MRDKPDIITFSGDKLIGGPQSGLVVGNKKWINSLKENTLYRVLRCDKITIGILEEVLRSYRSNSFTKNNIALKMLTTPRRTLLKRGVKILDFQTKKKNKDLGIKLENSKVEAGSGSLPEELIDSIAISFSSKSFQPNELAKRFRLGNIPVVGYINSNKFYIDLKAVLPGQVLKLAKAIREI